MGQGLGYATESSSGNGGGDMGSLAVLGALLVVGILVQAVAVWIGARVVKSSRANVWRPLVGALIMLGIECVALGISLAFHGLGGPQAQLGTGLLALGLLMLALELAALTTVIRWLFSVSW
jgi:hypothetical protein